MRENGGKRQEVWIDMYTLLHLKRITNKALLHGTGGSAQYHVAAWMGGGSGEDEHMYMHGWVTLLST